MGDWYEIGIAAGIGAAAAIAFAGASAGHRFALPFTGLASLAIAVVFGLSVGEWPAAATGCVAALLGAASAVALVRGASRRGATRVGTALVLFVVAVLVAALAFVPLVGYLEAVVLPALAARRARREPEKVAGLRSLAK